MYMSKENKIKQLQEQFFQLLRLSMGLTEQKDFEATAEDWQWLHEEAKSCVTELIEQLVEEGVIEAQ